MIAAVVRRWERDPPTPLSRPFSDELVRRFGCERAQAIRAYEDHNDAVRTAIDPGRLLVFDVREGWKPLCEFLRVDVPPEPFPCVNTYERLPV